MTNQVEATHIWHDDTSGIDPHGMYAHSPPSLRKDSLALVIIDMQNYGARTTERVGAMWASNPHFGAYWKTRLDDVVIPNIRAVLNAARDAGILIVHIRAGPFRPDGMDMSPRYLQRDQARSKQLGLDYLFSLGTWEHEIIDELTPAQPEIVLNKNTASAFNSTAIDSILRNSRVRTLVCVGQATNGCVESTARDAVDHGYSAILVDDACAALSRKRHDSALDTFSLAFGSVTTTQVVLQSIDSNRT